SFRASSHVLPVTYGNPDSREWTERSGAPSMPWPKFQASAAARANEAELAIIWRGHELRERHPGVAYEELAQMLARDGVWERHAMFVPVARRTIVIREAFVLW